MRNLFFLSLLLALIYVFRLLTISPPKTYLEGQEITLITTLSTQPQTFGQSQKFVVEEGIKVVTARYPEYHYGQKLKISGILQAGTPMSSSPIINLLKIERNDFLLFFPQIEVLAAEKGDRFWQNLFRLRQKLIVIYQEFLPEPSSSLLVGIVLGVKTQMSPDFKANLRRTGLTHVVVASGLNVTLVAGFLSGFLNLFLRRQLTLPFLLLGVFLYAALAGFEPPIIRASLMGFLALLAQALGRQNWAVLTLVWVGFLMLLVKPLLIFDLGFQLSFLATAGLILVKPILDNTPLGAFLGRVPLLGEGITTTLAAQLTTLPPILASFGIWPLLSLLANALVLWTVPYIMGIGGIIGLIGLVSKPAGQPLAFLLYAFLFYFEKVTSFFSQFSSFSLKTSSFPFLLSLSYFSFLIAVLLCLGKVKKGES